MNRMKVVTLTMLVLTAAMLLSVPAFADVINLTLGSPVQSTVAGNILSFTATAVAPSTNQAPVYLNSDSFNVDTPLTVDDSGFFFGFPLVMNPGDSFTGLLFTVDVPTGTANGSYFGYFQILGGVDGSDLSAVSNVTPFEVDVVPPPPVPEPGTMMLFGTTGLALFGMLRRKLS